MTTNPKIEQPPKCPPSPDGQHYFPQLSVNEWQTWCEHCKANAIIVGGEVLYVPTPLQAEYHSRTEPNVLLWGNRGGGKSFCGRWDAHMRALATPNFKYCILRRTFPELQSSHLNDLPDEMFKLGGDYHSTNHIARYHNGSLGFFRHCATDEHVLKLLSAEFHLMFFDEVSTFSWEMFTKLAASVRVKKDSGLLGMVRAATNPLGVSAEYVNRYWVLRDIEPDEDPHYNPNDWYDVKAQLDSNPYVDHEQYKKRFGTGMPSHVRKAWVDGEFGLENSLFDVFPTRDGKPYHYTPDVDLFSLAKNAQIYRAFDMGYFPDPAYCCWIAHLGHRFIVFHEKYWYKTIVEDIAKDILEIDKNLGVSRVVDCFCDPTIDIKTGADIYTMKDKFEMNGVPMTTSINSREHYAAAIHSALGEEAEPGIPRLQIYFDGRRKGCGYLAKTLPLQRFDPDHPLRLADHPDDHPTVALAYFLISSGALEQKGKISFSKPKKWMVEKKDRFTLGNESVRERK